MNTLTLPSFTQDTFAFLAWFHRVAFFREDARKEMKLLDIEPDIIVMLTSAESFRQRDVVAWIQAYGYDERTNTQQAMLKYINHYVDEWERIR